MIRAVLFDLGNVLVNFDAVKAAKRFSKEGEVPLWKVWLHFFTSPVEKAYTCGKISSREFYLHSKKALGTSMDYRTFCRVWNGIFWKNPGMEPLLKTLRLKYRLYLISNTNELHFKYIRKKYRGLLRPFHKLFPSHEVGYRKPDPRIYRKVLRTIKLRAHETVFIDDVPAFVKGARSVGMNAIRFRHPKQLRRDLEKLGVMISR